MIKGGLDGAGTWRASFSTRLSASDRTRPTAVPAKRIGFFPYFAPIQEKRRLTGQQGEGKAEDGRHNQDNRAAGTKINFWNGSSGQAEQMSESVRLTYSCIQTL